jgi:hypothetical protein
MLNSTIELHSKCASHIKTLARQDPFNHFPAQEKSHQVAFSQYQPGVHLFLAGNATATGLAWCCVGDAFHLYRVEAGVATQRLVRVGVVVLA